MNYDLVFQTTVATARRLFKSRLRLAICRLKEPESRRTWQPIILLEEGIEKEAQQAWDNVRSCWGIHDVDRFLLGLALKSALQGARTDAYHFFTTDNLKLDPAWVHAKILEFFP